MKNTTTKPSAEHDDWRPFARSAAFAEKLDGGRWLIELHLEGECVKRVVVNSARAGEKAIAAWLVGDNN